MGMAHWKVIALICGNIEAVSVPAAQDRPGTHEWIVWEGPAADKTKYNESGCTLAGSRCANGVAGTASGGG